jgi:Na+-transporting NADH:ubiquinone oxidoreductase subunit NqrD
VRALSWGIAAGIGYSFVLTFVSFVVSAVVKLFYPPSQIGIAPLLELFVSPAVGVVQIIVLGLMWAFSAPVTALRAELTNARSIVTFATVGYLFFSLLPYAFPEAVSQYPQSFVGLLIAANVLNGALAGAVAYKVKV